MESANKLLLKYVVMSLCVLAMTGAWRDLDTGTRLTIPPQLQQDRIMDYLYDTSRSRVRRGHRHMSDAGYGSRISAASKMMHALIAHHDVYGAFGPGKRKRTLDEDTSS